MRETIRAFLAVELAPDVRAALVDLIEQLGRSGLRGLRLVRPENIHLTLKFLGDVPVDQVDAIVAAVSRVAATHSPFELKLGGAGVFPNRRAARVLWVGIEGHLSPLILLRQQLDESMVSLGFASDSRVFSPHLTVGRIKDGARASDRERAAEFHLSSRIESGLPVGVESVGLIRSTLHPDGATYRRLASLALEGGSKLEGDG